MLLPYSAACAILETLPKLLRSESQAELVTRLALSLIKAHHGPIVANSELLPTLQEVRSLAMKRISSLRVHFFAKLLFAFEGVC